MSLGVPKIQDALGKKTGRLVDGQRSAGSRVVEGGGGSVQMSKPGHVRQGSVLEGAWLLEGIHIRALLGDYGRGSCK